ncbi:MAG TPA: hypothetical protein GXZ61_00300 [Clostridiales bacterium]|jgi:hypothetical protein|nr:hypothetical protein [Clostridiales bacterium]
MYITEKEIKPEAPYVELIIEGDPGDAWEGGINGRFYRISRGVPVRVPLSLAKLIYSNARVKVLSKSLYDDYKTESGKCLNSKKTRAKS